MFKELMNNLTDKVNTMKENNNHYKELLQTTTTFNGFFPIPELNIIPSYHRIITITTECPDINKEKATLISSLIPIEETFVLITYAKEIKTNKEYYLIPTNKYLWIINQNTYGAYPYDKMPCQVIKSNLMSKTILINNILLEVTGNDSKINTLISILTNNQERENIINEKTKYLCGITPSYQRINDIYSGISIDNNKNIVFHTKENNYLYNYLDISHYEILLDNSVILSTSNMTNTKISNFQNNCYQISIRVFAKDNTIINMPILEPNSFNTKYQRNDTVFQKNFNFAKEIIEKLISLSN